MIMFRHGWLLLRDTAIAWVRDGAPSMGAALAYYTVFSIAPLLLIVISIAGLVFGADAARGEILGQLQGLMGERGALAVQELLKSVSKPSSGVGATLAGTAALLVGATTVLGELQRALDRIWRAPGSGSADQAHGGRGGDRDEASRAGGGKGEGNMPEAGKAASRASAVVEEVGGGIWRLLRARLLSFGMILGIGFLLTVSTLASAALAAVANWWQPYFGGWLTAAATLNMLLGFGLTTFVFALIYKLIPRARIAWHDVWIGAAVTALLFTLGKSLIGLYIGKSAVSSAFGAAGSLVVLLVWVYYSAQIFLFGAEFTRVYAYSLGSFSDRAPDRGIA